MCYAVIADAERGTAQRPPRLAKSGEARSDRGYDTQARADNS